MKIKNLAFFGIMAAIMGIAGTARADTTTVIASQAYVDAKDALKQDNAKRIQTTKSAYDGLNKTADEKKEDYPSMFTLEDSITEIGSDNFATKNLDNLTETGKANVSAQGKYNSATEYDSGTVGAAIKSKQDTLNAANVTTDATVGTSSGSGVVTSVTADNGTVAITKSKIVNADVADNAQIARTKIDFTADELNALGSGITSALVGQITTNETNISNINAQLEKSLTPEQIRAYQTWVSGGRKTSGEAWTALQTAFAEDVDNVVSDYQENHQNLIPRNRNIQKGIAYLKGNGIEHYTQGVTYGEAENIGISNAGVKEKAEQAWKGYLTNGKADDYVPTVAAVEARVEQQARAAQSDYAYRSLTNLTDEGKANVSALGKYDSTTNYDTGTVGKAIKDNAADITTLNSNVNTAGSVLKTIKDNAENATFTPGNSGITATNLADAIKEVKTTAASGISDLDLTDTNTTGQPVVRVNQNNGVVEPVRGTITYKDGLESKLSNVNASGDAETAYKKCTTASPCTLTMFMNNDKPVYEWTNMDTENTDAVL